MSILARKLIINKVGNNTFEDKLVSRACDYQGYFLNMAIIAMFASQGKSLLENYKVLFILLVPILLFFTINFIVGRFVGKIIKLNYQDSVSLSLTTLARNSPVALTIAVAAFPDKPLIALALIIGPLIELPVLFLVSKILLGIKLRKELYQNNYKLRKYRLIQKNMGYFFSYQFKNIISNLKLLWTKRSLKIE